jgi:hypothetical protein
VYLYWDDEAESTFDRYINKIGGNGNDFEGYRIYRASDPAFLDAKVITNASGSPTFLLPIAQFDLEDGISGLDSIGYQGVHFNLGNDSGLLHSWVDNSVKNGFTYYYAITSYDFGYTPKGFAPTECKISISLNPDGTAKTLGKNVAVVTPEAPSGGYVSPTLGNIDLVSGYTSSQVFYEIIDPNNIKEGHIYYLTFEDTTVITSGKPDTLKTNSFTLTDSTANVVLVEKSTKFKSTDEGEIIDGFKLSFDNANRVELDTLTSGWNDDAITDLFVEKYKKPKPEEPNGQEKPNDYKVIFDEVGFDTSKSFVYDRTVYPSKPVNFKVFNVSENKFIDFAFIELDTAGTGQGRFSTNGILKVDRIVFLEKKQTIQHYPYLVVFSKKASITC